MQGIVSRSLKIARFMQWLLAISLIVGMASSGCVTQSAFRREVRRSLQQEVEGQRFALRADCGYAEFYD